MGGDTAFSIFIFIFIFFVVSANGDQTNHREALEIIIGGGGVSFSSPPPENEYCPPPLPPPCPPPPPPPCPSPLPPPPPPPKPHSPPHSPPPPPKPLKSPPPPPPTPRKSPPPPPKPLKSPPPPPPTPRKSPPPRKPPPPPSSFPFESERLKLVFPVIQKFKTLITDDPLGITKTWKGPNICAYLGFQCDIVPTFKQKAIAGVKFNNYRFYGPNLTLAEFIIGLPDLVYFHANSNNFTGKIPNGLNKLPFFYELDLSNNKFSGPFPSQVLQATKLQFLDLRFNAYAGVVPPQVFLLNLDLLFINNNKFVQKLPDNLGKTTSLYLTLANNQFVGGIPPSIGQANNTLLEVLFLNNKLTGCLPYEIGFLYKTTVFDVGFNSLTGPIPHSFQCLKKMELLNLAGNKFYGAVPEAVCGLPELENLTLSSNYFTQVGPMCRKRIKEGVINVKMNCILDLPNQRSPAECAHFFSAISPCPNERSLSYVPCRAGGLKGELTSSNVESIALSPATAPAPAPAKGLRRGSYGALSPH